MMKLQLRREVRLRREYLYRKAQENRLRTIEEKKQKVKKALEGRVPLLSFPMFAFWRRLCSVFWRIMLVYRKLHPPHWAAEGSPAAAEARRVRRRRSRRLVFMFVCSVCDYIRVRAPHQPEGLWILCTGVSSHIDDEYRWAGVEDPKVLVTTSRDPSSRLKMFAKVSVNAAKLFLLKIN